MVRVLSHRVLAAAVLVLTALPCAIPAQTSLPPLPSAGGGITDRLTPQEVERGNQRRQREQVVVRLRELQARGEYTEMLRLIQEAEKTLPNDMVLKQYGYMAQKGLDEVEQSEDPLISPNSPVLRQGGIQIPSGDPSATPGAGAATGGLPPLPIEGAAPAGHSASGLPPLPGSGSPVTGESPGSLPVLPGGSEESATPPAGTEPVPVSEVPAEAGQTAKSPMRLVLIGVAVLFGAVGLIALLRRRKSEDSASARKAVARPPFSPTPVGRPFAAGAAMPPPIPGGAPPPVPSMRDALTEVEGTEEEVARDIAQNIGTRTPAPSVGMMPTFDMFIPESKPDAPTGFHDNIPTMVDDVQDQPTMQDAPDLSMEPREMSSFKMFHESKSSPSDEPKFSPSDEPKFSPSDEPKFSPSMDETALPSSSAPPGGGLNMVSFADLGISFGGDDEPPAKPAPPPPPAPKPPLSAPEAPPLDLSLLSEPEVKSEPVKPQTPEPQPTLPGLPKGDEPIRLDDLNFFAPGAETVATPPPPARPKGDKIADDPMSATVDLSELLFGNQDAQAGGAGEKAGGDDATRTSAGPSSPSSRPNDETSVAIPPEGMISLDSLPGNSRQPSAPSDETAITDLHNQDTVQIPVLNEKAGPSQEAGGGHPDDSLEATVALGDPAAETVAATRTESFSAKPEKEPQSASKPEEQSYYAAAGGVGGSLDERSERMFREQCERADKAIGESNWKQAVHYLSIAAAIRPEDADLAQKLRNAREQKRRQEANV